MAATATGSGQVHLNEDQFNKLLDVLQSLAAGGGSGDEDRRRTYVPVISSYQILNGLMGRAGDFPPIVVGLRKIQRQAQVILLDNVPTATRAAVYPSNRTIKKEEADVIADLVTLNVIPTNEPIGLVELFDDEGRLVGWVPPLEALV